MYMLRLLLVLGWVALAPVAAQDEVVLADGRRFAGVIQWRTETHVALQASFGLIEFDRSHVAQVNEVTAAAVDRGAEQRAAILNLARRPAKAAVAASHPASPPASSPESPGVDPARRAAPPPARALDPAATDPASAPPRVAWTALAASGGASGREAVDLPAWLQQRLGPVFPRKPQSLLLLTLLFFVLLVFFLQLGCRFLDIDSFSMPRGLVLGTVVLLLLAAIYSLRGVLSSPLAGTLGGLAAFLLLVAAITTILQERAGKATALVGFLLFSGVLSASCILVGTAGVVALW